MSQSSPTSNQKMVTELKVSGHLMLLDPGLFCVFHSPGGTPADPQTGLPGVRITRPPTARADSLSISTFDADGWLGGEGNAALVRVKGAPSQVLVTIYQTVNSTAEAPKLQVLRLSEASPAAPAQASVQAPAAAPPPAEVAAPAPPAEPPGKPEVAAHVQRRGDVLTRLGDWMGVRGSQNWIEGFAIAPSRFVEPADIEYQAVLGKGWLSPWAEGGTYCGSRGMALPILGLRVRLKNDASERYEVRLSATFTDGTAIGPVDATETAETASLAPLEAFLVEILPLGGADASGGAAAMDRPSEPQPSARKAPRRPARAEPARPEPTRPEPARPVAAKAKAEKSLPPAPPARGASARSSGRTAPAAKTAKTGSKGRR